MVRGSKRERKKKLVKVDRKNKKKTRGGEKSYNIKTQRQRRERFTGLKRV